VVYEEALHERFQHQHVPIPAWRIIEDLNIRRYVKEQWK